MAESEELFFEEEFEHLVFAELEWTPGLIELCSFSKCDFSHANLSGFKFEDCTFESCDFSMAKIAHAAFRGVRFKQCKMLGVKFETCNPFLLELCFSDCQLDLSSFYQLDLKATVFQDCQLREVDFSSCNLSGASFSGSDLQGAIFDATRLVGADFRSASHFTINPSTNTIKKAKFSRDALMGLLTAYNIVVE